MGSSKELREVIAAAKSAGVSDQAVDASQEPPPAPLFNFY